MHSTNDEIAVWLKWILTSIIFEDGLMCVNIHVSYGGSHTNMCRTAILNEVGHFSFFSLLPKFVIINKKFKISTKCKLNVRIVK